MTEDQDLMAKISQLAGQINRHKTQQSQPESPYISEIAPGHHVSRHVPYRGRGWAPYRGRHYARGRHVAPHRHRTLILNNATSGTPGSATPAGTGTDTDGEARSATPNEWVVKRDRHMQLINTSIYDKETQARTKAMEESRQAKAQKRAQVEQARVLNYAQGVGRVHPTGFAAPQVSTADPSAEYQVFVNDIPFRVSRGGGKLIRVSGACAVDTLVKRTSLPVIDNPNTANATPKRVTVAGVAFVRSKNGNLHRLGAVTSKRKPMTVKKKNALCQRFTTTGTNAFPTRGPEWHLPPSHYLFHLLRDHADQDLQPFRQLLQRTNMPLYSRPEQGCNVQGLPSDWSMQCRDFAVLGYCEKGAECDQRHVHECPDYANEGVCNKKRCRLPHVDRAGQIRKNAASKTDAMAQAEESDASSEEEEYDEIDTDDVDSDDLDEDEPQLIAAESDTGEVSQQQDYIRL
ncbi:unnamed protein product [Aspergillus niger]|nr:unnamed protein product [Aspergillus niger]